ncbi:MAG TPA: response regulator, partial [Gemmataceae bacterium]|nr:response regulator [Gemmataceae bacterium]
ALLRHRGGMNALTAANGAVALAMLESVKPDVILLDMLMPEMDGWKFLEALRESSHRAIPIVITTAVGLTRDWAEQHECAGFLKKPFDENEVLAEIRRALRGGPPDDSGPLRLIPSQ